VPQQKTIWFFALSFGEETNLRKLCRDLALQCPKRFSLFGLSSDSCLFLFFANFRVGSVLFLCRHNTRSLVYRLIEKSRLHDSLRISSWKNRTKLLRLLRHQAAYEKLFHKKITSCRQQVVGLALLGFGCNRLFSWCRRCNPVHKSRLQFWEHFHQVPFRRTLLPLVEKPHISIAWYQLSTRLT